MALGGLDKLEWLEPWYEDFSGLEGELGREVSADHPLFGVRAIALARGRGDDVLFHLPDYSPPFAVVHLTWSKESTPVFPHTLFYASLEDFVERRMKSDHREYMETPAAGE